MTIWNFERSVYLIVCFRYFRSIKIPKFENVKVCEYKMDIWKSENVKNERFRIDICQLGNLQIKDLQTERLRIKHVQIEMPRSKKNILGTFKLEISN